MERGWGDVTLSAEDDLVGGLTDMVQQIWKEKGLPEGTINKEVTTEFAKRFFNGVLKGYGKAGEQFALGKLDYNTPDYNKLASIQKNCWQFAAAKNYQQLRALGNALIGDDGKLRTFSQFKEAAQAINNQQLNWLKTEYNLAVAGGQMASKWVDIEKDEDLFPYLEFDAVMDNRTSEICRPLNGTTLPSSDPFWNMYYPPNHFGCRSTVRQRGGSYKTTPHHDIPSAEIPPMFRVNLAKEGLVFPPKHPYWEDIPAGIKDGAMSAIRKELFDNAKERLKGKEVDVPHLGKVGFSNNGLKEIFNQPHDEYELKNQLATISNLLLENAKLIKSSPDDKGGSKTYHYLKVKGLSDKFILVVRENQEGIKTLYSIVDHIK